jgi:thymidylate synthase (FAD)
MNPMEIRCFNHGLVALVDVMGDDRTAPQTARTSFRNTKERTADEDKRLLSYLIEHRHTTPLEFMQLRFYVKMPIFVARQLVRHRMSSINEMSMRYVTATPEYYVPDVSRMNPRAENNKQGSNRSIVLDSADDLLDYWRKACDQCFLVYERMIEADVAPEIARGVLPVATYTEWYQQWDMHNFLHMLKLRLDAHAQWETRVFARAMYELARACFPDVIDLWTVANNVRVDDIPCQPITFPANATGRSDGRDEA